MFCEVFGPYVERAVEMANASGDMLGMVARKPLLKLNGSGQNRIAVRYKMPSRRKTWPRATKRWSLPTILSTYLLKTVRLARNAQRLPAVQATATRGHPLGNPYTRPAIVLAVEYPMTGGKAVTKMRAKTINQPPRSSRHDLAMGASQAKKRCE